MDTDPTGTMKSDFQSPDCEKINLCCLSWWVSGNSLQQSWEANKCKNPCLYFCNCKSKVSSRKKQKYFGCKGLEFRNTKGDFWVK